MSNQPPMTRTELFLCYLAVGGVSGMATAFILILLNALWSAGRRISEILQSSHEAQVIFAIICGGVVTGLAIFHGSQDFDA